MHWKGALTQCHGHNQTFTILSEQSPGTQRGGGVRPGPGAGRVANGEERAGWLGWQRRGLGVHTAMPLGGGVSAAVHRGPGTWFVYSVSLVGCDGGASFEH